MEKVNKSSVTFVRFDVSRAKCLLQYRIEDISSCVVIFKSKNISGFTSNFMRIESLVKHLRWNILQK